MEKNRGHRNKHTEQRAIWFLTKKPKTYNAERTASLTHGPEKNGIYMQKTDHSSCTKVILKCDKDLNVIFETFTGKQGKFWKMWT
jgi:hypothetical protein